MSSGADSLPGDVKAALDRASELIFGADALLVTAGAGIGIDSGLPDFRGPGGFWRAYPALGRRGIDFTDIASPAAFDSVPRLAWGFYGHRLALYRATRPHKGFSILRRLGKRTKHGLRVFTSNVDGQFQRAGFDEMRVCEVHGSIHHLQCMDGCGDAIVPADDFHPEVDERLCQLRSPLPRCSCCNALLRPNVLMFGDGGWLGGRTSAQQRRLSLWLRSVARPVIVEIGAGSHVPTVRWFSESLGAPLIRINPTEPDIPGRGVSLACGGLEALTAIHAALIASGFLPPAAPCST